MQSSPVDLDSMRAALAEYKALQAEREEIDERMKGTSKRLLASLEEPIDLEEVPKLLALVMEHIEGIREAMRQTDSRVDWLVTQNMEGAIAVAEAQQRQDPSAQSR